MGTQPVDLTNILAPVEDLSEIFYHPHQPRNTKGQFHPHNPRTIPWNGFTIQIENPAGSVRRGDNPDGSAWKTLMGWHYGCLEGVPSDEGDGSDMDAFVGTRLDAPNVYAARIIDAAGNQCFHETKLVIGAESEDEARRVIIEHYGDEPLFFESVTTIPVADFAAWVTSSPHVRLGERQGSGRWRPPGPASLCANCGGRGCGPILCSMSLEGDQNPYALIDTPTPYLDSPLSEDGRISAAQAGYMELEGAVKDSECEKVRVDGGVAAELGCCNEFDPQENTRRFSCGTCTNVTIVDNTSEALAERGSKLRRTVETPYWHKRVLPSERHVNFAEIDRTMRTAGNKLSSALKGKPRARVIREIAHQAVQQHHSGRRSAEFQFAHDHALQGQIAEQIKDVYDASRQEAKAEVERQVGGRK